MKVRIIDAGFAKYTGQFGAVDFVDGVSDEISSAEAARLGSILRIEIEGTGVNPSATQLLVDVHNKNLDDLGVKRFVEPKAAAAVNSKVEQEVKQVAKPQAELDYSYTEEDLAGLVKKEGIAGLRSFTEQFGVNGRSIVGMIGEMMDLKNLHQPVKQVEPEKVIEENEVIEEGKSEGHVGDAAEEVVEEVVEEATDTADKE